jgi:hypothetical protein
VGTASRLWIKSVCFSLFVKSDRCESVRMVWTRKRSFGVGSMILIYSSVIFRLVINVTHDHGDREWGNERRAWRDATLLRGRNVWARFRRWHELQWAVFKKLICLNWFSSVRPTTECFWEEKWSNNVPLSIDSRLLSEEATRYTFKDPRSKWKSMISCTEF